MILLTARLSTKPEKRQQFIEAIELICATSRQEPGVVEHRVYADMTDPNIFFLFEHYEDEEALALHRKTQRIQDWEKHAMEYFTSADVHWYIANETMLS